MLNTTAAPTCIVVDDDEMVRETISRILAGLGCNVSQCETPETLASCRAEADLVLLDLSLRDSDAVQVLRSLNACGYKGAIALMSGHDARTIEQVQRIGIDHRLAMLPFIRKPVRTSDLAALLDTLANAPRDIMPVPASASAPRGKGGKRTSRMFQTAIERGRLELWYQPKVSLRDGAVVGFEALVRLRHPRLGLLLPDQFLPRPGDLLHVELAEFVVERAMSEQSHLRAAGLPARIAVNIPLVALRNQKFLELLRTAIRDCRAPDLIAEITEDEALSDAALVYESALQLRLMGVGLSIDDFGTGYSSLARICELPFSEVKLDRRFVMGCDTDPLKRGICQTVIDLAHRFQAKVVAEGVETWEDLQALRKMNCDYAQGYLIAKPMPMQRLVDLELNNELIVSGIAPPDDREIGARKLRLVAG